MQARYKKSLTNYAARQLRVIHGNSCKLNHSLNRKHASQLLAMMHQHIGEIKERYRKSDKHYLIETGDLIVLGLELIKEAQESPDAVLFKCYPRFRRKLLQLLKGRP